MRRPVPKALPKKWAIGYAFEKPETHMTEADIAYCADQVRRHDPDRYLLALLAPADARPALLAVYAFNIEIAKIRESVTEAMLGEIRLQWWRDTLDILYDGRRREHAVARLLGAAIRRHDLSRQCFDRLIEGRASDLDRRAPGTMDDLLRYAEATSAPLVHLALETMEARDDASFAAGTHAGTAWALAGLIRAMPAHRAAGWHYLPQDRCRANGLDLHRAMEGEGREALVATIRDVAEAAESEIATAREMRSRVSRPAVPALLPATFAASCLRSLRRAGYDPYDSRVASPPPMMAWRLALRRAVGRY
jgi:NADH dehydrogenase [ubiquinone] 1 alpha subcomplex assembly factor 6